MCDCVSIVFASQRRDVLLFILPESDIEQYERMRNVTKTSNWHVVHTSLNLQGQHVYTCARLLVLELLSSQTPNLPSTSLLMSVINDVRYEPPLMSLLKASVYAGTRPIWHDSRIRHVLDVNRELMGFVMSEVGIKRTSPTRVDAAAIQLDRAINCRFTAILQRNA